MEHWLSLRPCLKLAKKKDSKKNFVIYAFYWAGRKRKWTSCESCPMSSEKSVVASTSNSHIVDVYVTSSFILFYYIEKAPELCCCLFSLAYHTNKRNIIKNIHVYHLLNKCNIIFISLVFFRFSSCSSCNPKHKSAPEAIESYKRIFTQNFPSWGLALKDSSLMIAWISKAFAVTIITIAYNSCKTQNHG